MGINQTEFDDIWNKLKAKAEQSEEVIITDDMILDKTQKQIWRFKR